MTEKIDDKTVDLSLQEKMRKAKIARQQLINAERRYDRTKLPKDFTRIEEKQQASNKADAELNGHAPRTRMHPSLVPQGAKSNLDERFLTRWNMVRDLRGKEKTIMRRFMRDGTSKQLDRLQEIQNQIEAIESKD